MDGSSGTEVLVRQAVSPYVRIIASSHSSAEKTDALHSLKHYLEDGNASANERAEFNRAHYTRVLQVLISNLTSDWFHSLHGEERRELWDGFFLRGPPDQALLVLLDTVSSTSAGSGLDQCVSVLERFLSAGRVEVLLWSKCLVVIGGSDSAQLRETVLTRLSSLPDLTANRLQTHTPSPFLPPQYYTHLAEDVLKTLEKTCQALRGGQDCSLGFVAQLLGKVCMQGHGECVFEILAPRLSSLTRSDALWRRVSCKLLENVPERWIESAITALIHHLHSASALSRLMDNLVLKNKKVQFVLTHKLLLLQYQHPTRLLRNVLGYLALDVGRRPLLKQVMRSVCQVWCNSSAVRHTPLEQQLYVSRALLLSVSLLNPAEIPELREVLLQCMLGGVQCRLDSSIERVRRMGMVVGECLSQKLDTPTYQLKFQYEADEESRELQSLTEPQSEDDQEDQQPANEAHRVELSLQAAEGLLRKNVSATREVSVQFSKVMLHLEDRYSTAGFHTLRQNAMVALTVTDTQPVVEYLTAEFYSLNYSLRQRLDILEVNHCLYRTSLVQFFWRDCVKKPVIPKYVIVKPLDIKVINIRTASKRGSGSVTFDLLGSDHLVLGRLLHTLGLLMHLAINAPVATQMGKALLDFVWAIRFHTDQMVRRGVLFAVCAVFLSMPSDNLLLELSDDLVETRAWLAGTVCLSVCLPFPLLYRIRLSELPDSETTS
uniref:Telomere length regulation protein TEL2 homolog n=1 Tax=Astyanax mexicanus TaxID=7994 RepID=A0A8B9HW75_ASTMX